MFAIFTPLNHKSYRLFFAAQTIALIGTGLSTIALALFAFSLDNGRAAEIISFALAAKMIAYIGIAPIIGGFAHRLPQKYLMVFFDLCRAGLLFSLPFISEIWHIYILIFAINVCSAGFTPLYQAILPALFNDVKQYGKALALSRMTYDLENLLSPTLAALLLIFVDFEILFHINSAAFLASAGLLFIVTFPNQINSTRQAGIWHNISYGIKSYWATPRLRGLLSFNFIAALTGALIIVNSANYAQNIFGQDKTITALLFASVGVGAMLASFTMPRLMVRLTIRNIMKIGSILSIIGLVSFLLLPNLYGLFLVWFILGICSSLLQTPSGIVIQKSSQIADRPSYFSAQFTLTHMGWLVAYLLAGQIGQYLSIEAAVVLLAVITALSLLMAVSFWKKDAKDSLYHSHQAHEHLHLHVHDEHHQHEHDGSEGPEPHAHPHQHQKQKHKHKFFIDEHHHSWPR